MAPQHLNPPEAAAFKVMQDHIDALNARNEQAIAATLHFPHFRLSGTKLQVWDTPDSYFADFRARAGADWARSDFANLHAVQSARDKVHICTDVLRFSAAGQRIAAFPSLWVITLQEGRWAAKFRSSFAAL